MRFDSAADMNEGERCVHSWGREECVRGGAGFCLFLKQGCTKKYLAWFVSHCLPFFQNIRVLENRILTA